jgi:hypothetical protein
MVNEILTAKNEGSGAAGGTAIHGHCVHPKSAYPQGIQSIIVEMAMFRTILALAVLAAVGLLAGEKVQAQGPAAVRPATSLCVYADRTYSKGAIVCAGPRISMECLDDQKWKATVPSGTAPSDIVAFCRDAPFVAPPIRRESESK